MRKGGVRGKGEEGGVRKGRVRRKEGRRRGKREEGGGREGERRGEGGGRVHRKEESLRKEVSKWQGRGQETTTSDITRGVCMRTLQKMTYSCFLVEQPVVNVYTQFQLKAGLYYK